MQLLFHTLPNNIRLVHKRIQGNVAYCGVIINAGSRDESEKEHGVAHFIEHMLFKGTSKRKPYHILSRLEDTGGELNAYTTKEETAVHASFLRNDYERAIELISDITFNSIFPGKEIEKEKDVVIEEIKSYRDNPSELIYDDFEELVFAGMPIARNILGSVHSVKKINRDKIISFINHNYSTDEIVFCSVGDIEDRKIIYLFQKYFSAIPDRSSEKKKAEKLEYKPGSLLKKKDTFQNHCIIGNLAYDIRDSRRVGMFLLNNIIGGPGLNSRLNLSLRERNGLAYNVESSYNPYSDTGVFSIYFGTDSKLLDKSISLCLKELTRLRTERLGTIQMSKACTQMKGYLARSFENHESLMLSLAKNIIVFNKADSFEELCNQIDKLTSSDILEMANEILEPSRLSTLIYK
ncbi:MAG TPA: pitrilysin family protein [Bacteroidales bacterium]|nr:pitrilysin family protein [Bacteroidales bacterium]